jgi:dipeptidyl aminopeptidase/acylaminoacyl peptidase
MNRNRIARTLLLPTLLLAIAAFSPLLSQVKRPIELQDLFKIKRVSDPQLSPDGKWVAYVVAEVDKPNNKSNNDIWIIPSGGGEARRFAGSPKQDRHPRWSPDGKWIAFESNRSGSYQIYVQPVEAGEAKQLTSISTEANQAVWSPDGKNIAFVSAVFPEFSDKPYSESNALNKSKQDGRDTSKVKARIMTKLLYRHWDSWVDDKRQHLFVVPVAGGDPRDVTPGDRDAVPTSSTFSAGDDFDFSPDGGMLAYTATPVPPHDESWSTNHDIYEVNLATMERKQLTTNLAADGFPRYSPDGKYIAFRAQSRPGFEADRWQLMIYDRSAHTSHSLTTDFDAGIESIVWSHDGKTLYFEAEEKANRPLWSVTLRDDDIKKVVDGAVNGDINVSPNGKMLVFSRQSFTRPVEIYTASPGGKNAKPLTHVNDDLFSQLTFTEPEAVWFAGAGGTQVQMWIIKPPTFSAGATTPAGSKETEANATKKYPLVFWAHGGPQGAFMNSWSFRWNPELWAAKGYVLALPNPRGSTGFGQKFVDEISRDWGGKVYVDLMNGLDYMEQLPYVDTSRMAAAGASFGGYMMDWFEGHTDKFKTIITHDGVYNFNSMYGVTEETWFDEWEHGIPWETPDYDKFSPHKYAANFKTPALIIHSELDYRVPVGEGMSLFTALQRKGIPSKWLYFPDEGHWVLKPLNSELWHKTVFEWLDGYLKPDASGGVSQ